MALVALGRPLRPIYPSFPERGYSHVNILLEGPSILGVTREDLLHGPTIAVNHALALSTSLPVEFWGTADNPKNLWAWAAPHLHPETKFFTTTNNVLAWHDVLQDSIVPRLYAPEEMETLRSLFKDEVGDEWESLGKLYEVMGDRLYSFDPVYMQEWMDNGKAPLLPTVAFVLAWLASFPETKHVRLFGCDMRGTNSPLSALPYSPTAEHIGWTVRWQIERTLLSLIIKEYRRRGKRIERWSKNP